MRTKWNLGALANLSVVLLVGFVLLRPAGPWGAAISQWRRDAQLRSRISERWTELVRAPRLDNKTDSVTLVEFSDYECPVCKSQHEMLTKIAGDPRVGGIAFRHYPLPARRFSAAAARAAICAEHQGQFREFHNQLFGSDTWMRDTNWTREAAAAGVPDTSAFKVCLTSQQTISRLQQDIALANEVGVTGTPTYVHSKGVFRVSMRDTTFLRIAALSGR